MLRADRPAPARLRPPCHAAAFGVAAARTDEAALAAAHARIAQLHEKLDRMRQCRSPRLASPRLASPRRQICGGSARAVGRCLREASQPHRCHCRVVSGVAGGSDGRVEGAASPAQHWAEAISTCVARLGLAVRCAAL